MKRSTLLLVLASFLAAPLGATQEPLPAGAPQRAEELPDARAVIERFATVTKLREKLATTRSRHEKGTARIGTASGRTESWSVAPSRNRNVLALEGFGEMVSGCDGDVAWITSPVQGTVVYEGADLLRAKLEAAWGAPLKPVEHFETMRTVGTRKFEGKECIVIELVARPLPGMDAEKTRAARTTQELYDVESGLLVGSEGTLDGELVKGRFTNTYSDYRDFGGVLLAARNVVRQDEVEVVLTLEAVEFDTVTDADVAVPEEVRQRLAVGSLPLKRQ